MTDTTEPVAYYCDHRAPGSPPHQSIELPEGEGYQVQERPEVRTALEFADQRHRPEHLRDFHCPVAVPLYRPNEHRDLVLTEGAELIRATDRDHYYDESADGIWLAAADLLLAARTTTAQEG